MEPELWTVILGPLTMELSRGGRGAQRRTRRRLERLVMRQLGIQGGTAPDDGLTLHQDQLPAQASKDDPGRATQRA